MDGMLDSILVGETTVVRTAATKLLGVYINGIQDWQTQLKALSSTLNQRLFVIRRVIRLIPSNKVMNILHSLWVSKLRYGLQLCIRVLLKEDERRSKALKTLQLTQNRLLRVLKGTKIKDRVSISSMLENSTYSQ